MHGKQEWADHLETADLYSFDEVDVQEQGGDLPALFVGPFDGAFERDECALFSAIDAAEQQFGDEWTAEQMQQVLASYIGADYAEWPADTIVINNEDNGTSYGFHKCDVRRCVVCRATEALHEIGAAPFCYTCAPQIPSQFLDALHKRGLFCRPVFGPGFDATITFFNTNGSKLTATNIGQVEKMRWKVTDEKGNEVFYGAYASPAFDKRLAFHAKLTGPVKKIQL